MCKKEGEGAGRDYVFVCVVKVCWLCGSKVYEWGVCSARGQEEVSKVLSRGREQNKQESRFFLEKVALVAKKSRVAKRLLDLTEDVWVRRRGIVVVREVVAMIVIMVMIMLLRVWMLGHAGAGLRDIWMIGLGIAGERLFQQRLDVVSAQVVISLSYRRFPRVWLHMC